MDNRKIRRLNRRAVKAAQKGNKRYVDQINMQGFSALIRRRHGGCRIA